MENLEKQCVEFYDGLLKSIQQITELTLENQNDISNELKQKRILNFYNLIDDNIFTLFVQCKIKVFSSKTEETNNLSNSLFNENYSLKFLFNNRPDFTKVKLWLSLLDIYNQLESNRKLICNEEPREERLKYVSDKIQELNNELSSKVKNNILNVEVNNTTNSMIDDIVGSFQATMNKNANPFDNIMEITNKITEKYHQKIEDGDIEIDKIMSNIQTSLPGVNSLFKQGEQEEKEKIIIDNNFSTADVKPDKKEVEKENKPGMNIGNMMNSMSNLPDLGNLNSMISKMSNVKSDEDMESVKNEMNQFLSKELKIDVNDINKNMEDLQKKLENEKLKDSLVEE